MAVVVRENSPLRNVRKIHRSRSDELCKVTFITPSLSLSDTHAQLPILGNSRFLDGAEGSFSFSAKTTRTTGTLRASKKFLKTHLKDLLQPPRSETCFHKGMGRSNSRPKCFEKVRRQSALQVYPRGRLIRRKFCRHDFR